MTWVEWWLVGACREAYQRLYTEYVSIMQKRFRSGAEQVRALELEGLMSRCLEVPYVF